MSKAKGISKRGIRIRLEGVIKDIVKSIDNPEIQEIFKTRSIITGGCIASMLLGEKVNDYDIYFMDMESAKKVAEFFINRDLPDKNVKVGLRTIKNIQGVDEERIYCKLSSGLMRALHKDRKYSLRVLTSNAITLSEDVQLITRFYGDPAEIFKNFDFVHCTNYYLPVTNTVYLNSDALASLLAKRLIYHGSLYPIASILRIRKFLDRGWSISAGQVAKMSLQLPGMVLNGITLTEQLLGVDLLYMHSFLEMLKLKEDDELLDMSRIHQLLDEVFDS